MQMLYLTTQKISNKLKMLRDWKKKKHFKLKNFSNESIWNEYEVQITITSSIIL